MMRKETLLRFGFASLLLGGGMGAMFAVGCSGDDTNGGSPSTPDSGPDSTTPLGDDDGSIPITGDGGPGTDADAAPPPVPAKLILVHAANAAPVRLCIGYGNPADGGTAIIQPTPPLPNNAGGLPPGLGGPAPKTASLAGQDLTVYAIPSSEISNVVPTDAGTELTCKDLLGKALTDGVDASIPDGGPAVYFKLGTIPKGTLVDGSSWLLAVVGSAPTYSVLAYKLDNTTTVPSDGVGGQFVHASAAYDAVLSAGLGGAKPPIFAGFYVAPPPVPVSDAGVVDAGDAGVGDAGDAAVDAATVTDAGTVANVIPALYPIEPGVNFGGPLSPATLAIAKGVVFNGLGGITVFPVTDAGTRIGEPVAEPFPAILGTSWPNGVPADGVFENGKGYVFVLVGNPTMPTFGLAADGGPTFNPLGLHVLGFPTNPAVQ